MSIDQETTFYCKSNHFDILSEVDYKIEESPIQWKWHHIKVHQDYHIGTVDRRATLNIECNHAAKKMWETDQETWPGNILTYNLKDDIWRLYTKVPTNYSGKQILKLGTKNPLISLWTLKILYIPQSWWPSGKIFRLYISNTKTWQTGKRYDMTQKISTHAPQMGGHTILKKHCNRNSNGK